MQKVNELIIGLALLSFSGLNLFAQASLADSVASFYPQKLVTSGSKVQDQRISCFSVYDTFANAGPRTVIAAYSNGFVGDVLVLQANQAGQFAKVYETDNILFLGAECSIQLIDVNGDGINEILLSFASQRGNSIDWIFTWNGSALSAIGPTTTEVGGRSVSTVMNASFFDLYHDGSLYLWSKGEYPPPIDGSLPSDPDQLFGLVRGLYQPLPNSRLFVAPIAQDSDQFQSVMFGFSGAELAQGPFVLRIINGDKNGQNRFSAGVIELNGQVVASNHINTSTEFVSVPVNLKDENTINISLTGVRGDVAVFDIENLTAESYADLDGDGVINCLDLTIVKASFGKKTGQAGFDPRADVNGDGVVNVLDLSAVAKQLPAGTVCH